jgi:hypothetical protein
VNDLSVPPIADSVLADAEQLLLAPSGLDHSSLSRVLAEIHSHDIDFADLYFQHARFEGWSLEEGIVKSAHSTSDRGVGVRAVSGDRQAYAYSDDISLTALTEAAHAVRAIARQGQTACAPLGQRGRARALYSSIDPVGTLGEADKVAILERIERIARARTRGVTHVMASLAGEHETILIARSDGLVVADVRPLVRMSITVIVEENGRREQGYSGGGGRFDYAYFTDEILTRYAHEAVAQGAAQPLRARGSAGNMTVVLGNGWPGILLHEAIGHGLEGDFNRKGTSAFSAVSASASHRRRHRRRRRHALSAPRLAQHRRRRQRDAAHGADRGRHPAGLHAGSRQLVAHEVGNHRQRPPRIVRAPADAAHDEHDHAARRARSRGDHRVGEERPVRGQLRRRPGRHHERQVRVLRAEAWMIEDGKLTYP